MKILLVYGTFPPFQDGGGSYCYELYSYLTSQGHDTHVLTSSFIGNKHELELEHNGKVHLLVDRWDLKGVFGSDRVKVKNFLQKNMFDKTIVLYPTTFVRDTSHRYILPMIFPFLRGVGSLTLLWFTPIPPKPKLIDLSAAFILTFFSSKILSEDRGTVSLMSKIFPFFNKKITWLPIGPTMAYEKDLNKEDLRKKYNFTDDVFYLSFFGYRYPSKGVDILLKAVERINSTHTKNTKKIKILMVGGHDSEDYTEYDKKMIKLAIDLGLEDDIIYTGKIDDRIINEYLKASDLYVTPFRRIFTGRSSIVPPIYLGIPYLTSMKKDKNGPFKHKYNCYIVRPNSVESLVLGIQEMASNESLRLTCQKNITDLTKTFNWSTSEAIMLKKNNV